MGLTSLQVCMDPSEWLQGAMSDDGVIDTSSPSSVDMLTCSRPMMERRLRPPHDQVQKCPRCESTHTKFCYYNNYSLSQPRYFCKTCRRYWTKGGTLRNIPVGGGCRKNKKSSSGSKKSSDHQSQSASIGQTSPFMGSGPNPTDLQLSFPEVQLSHHLTSLIGAHAAHSGSMSAGFLDDKYGHIGFLESKFDALVGHGAPRGHEFHGSSNIGVDFGIVGGGGFGSDYHLSAHSHHHGLATPSDLINTHSSSSGFGFPIDGTSSSVLENNYQRLMLPYDYHQSTSNDHHDRQDGLADVKPNPKLLSLEWHDNNGVASGNKDSFGYNGGVNGLTSWGSAMFNGYNPSTTNPLI